MKLYNTLSNSVEKFEPLDDDTVRMYNCGPTVYSEPHIGNFRAFLIADLLRRTLEFQGYEVKQVMNITDVGHLEENGDGGEDKLEKAARKEDRDVWEIAEYYTDVFLNLIDTLNIKRADHYPRATEHIEEMIEVVETLLEKGYAYEVEGEVYFEVQKFESYGKLSQNTLEDLDAGHRIDVDPKKKDPRDFALWKQDPDHQMQWDSPWGKGFPGWHIECSTMASTYLGDTIDIHTGGEDNIFPHHESEIAQSEGATGQQFVRYWLHVRHFLINGEKMSKSLGNFYTVREILDMGYSPEVLRLSLLRSHYRQNMNFREEGLEESEKQIDKLTDLRNRMREATGENGGEPSSDTVKKKSRDFLEDFEDCLADDLNISGALGELFDYVRAINRDVPYPSSGDAREVLDTLEKVDEVLAILPETRENELTDEQERKIQERERARENGHYEKADRLREELAEDGVIIEDTPEGTRWKINH